MPYIKQERRKEIENGELPENSGELNFVVTSLIDKYLMNKGKTRYTHLNDAIGVIECVKLELYRRIVSPYEDEKIKENGDVYIKRK
ncbi:MAG: hypothetical protein H8E98_03850 [Bacteroidetes bacterium]|nr:hypothetical protein [Bacteroidota bacterium]